jgi:hypothetical protein
VQQTRALVMAYKYTQSQTTKAGDTGTGAINGAAA